MICGPIEFDPEGKASPPAARFKFVRYITDPQELAELARLLAAQDGPQRE